MRWIIILFFLSPIIVPIVMYVVLPITLFTIIGITIAGIASTIYVAPKNLGAALIEAHQTVK